LGLEEVVVLAHLLQLPLLPKEEQAVAVVCLFMKNFLQLTFLALLPSQLDLLGLQELQVQPVLQEATEASVVTQHLVLC
jgi:hypothetical protein